MVSRRVLSHLEDKLQTSALSVHDIPAWQRRHGGPFDDRLCPGLGGPHEPDIRLTPPGCRRWSAWAGPWLSAVRLAESMSCRAGSGSARPSGTRPPSGPAEVAAAPGAVGGQLGRDDRVKPSNGRVRPDHARHEMVVWPASWCSRMRRMASGTSGPGSRGQLGRRGLKRRQVRAGVAPADGPQEHAPVGRFGTEVDRAARSPWPPERPGIGEARPRPEAVSTTLVAMTVLSRSNASLQAGRATRRSPSAPASACGAAPAGAPGP
jgi:hypothetical protein